MLIWVEKVSHYEIYFFFRYKGWIKTLLIKILKLKNVNSTAIKIEFLLEDMNIENIAMLYKINTIQYFYKIFS